MTSCVRNLMVSLFAYYSDLSKLFLVKMTWSAAVCTYFFRVVTVMVCNVAYLLIPLQG
jgi:hypothetical protein